MKSIVLAYSLLIGAALSAASWDTGSWDIETWQPAANNILSGLQPAEGSNVTPYADDKDVGGAEKFTDGKVPTVQGGDQYADTSKVMRPELSMIGDKNVLVYRWSGVMDIKDVRLYTMWCDGGRDYIRVYGVDYLTTASADWKEISGSELAAFQTETFRNRAILRAGDGEFLAEGAIALRIRFGSQENKFCGYAEIEATGIESSLLIGSLKLDDHTVNSASLSAEIDWVGSGATSATLYFGYGTDRDTLVLSQYEGGTLTMENPRMNIALTGLEEGKTYFYKYYFINDAGVSTVSTEASFATVKVRLDVVEDLFSGYDLAGSSFYLDDILGGPYSGVVKIDGNVIHGEISESSPFKLYGNGGTLVLNGTGLENSPLLLNGSGTFSFAGDRVIDNEGDIAFAEGSSAVYNQEGELAFSNFAWKYPSENISFGSLRIGDNASFTAKSPEKETDCYRFYRFVVDKTASGGMQMMEFEIYSGAIKVEVNSGMGSSYGRPAGTSGQSAGNVLDGNIDTKFYDGNVAQGNCYLQIDLGEGNAQAVTGYRWMTGDDNSSWNGRNPTAWRFLGSNDGEDWVLLDQYENMPELNSNYKWTDDYVFYVGSGGLVDNKPIVVEEGGMIEFHGTVRPFSVSGGGTVKIVGKDSALCLIGTENPDMTGGITGEGSLVKEGLSAISAKGVNTYQGETVIANGTYNVYGNSQPIRYFKLVITDAGANDDHCTQLTRFALFDKNGVDQALGLSMKGVGADASTLEPGHYLLAMDYHNYSSVSYNIFRDNYDKWCFANQNGGVGNATVGDGTYTLIMRLKDEAEEVVSYNFRSAGDDYDYKARSLRGWILYGSENGTDWFVLDERKNFPNVGENNVWYNGGAAFPCRNFIRTNDRDYTIPYGSVVEVARGARLGVYTAMTISALRIALDGEGASPVVDGLNMASAGALYLTSEADVDLVTGYQLPINLKNLGARSNWPVYLNGKRTNFIFHAVEGDGASYLKKSGMRLIVR